MRTPGTNIWHPIFKAMDDGIGNQTMQHTIVIEVIQSTINISNNNWMPTIGPRLLAPNVHKKDMMTIVVFPRIISDVVRHGPATWSDMVRAKR